MCNWTTELGPEIRPQNLRPENNGTATLDLIAMSTMIRDILEGDDWLEVSLEPSSIRNSSLIIPVNSDVRPYGIHIMGP